MNSSLLTTLALTPLALMAQDRVKPVKPNIIVILADDLGLPHRHHGLGEKQWKVPEYKTE